MSSLSSTLSSIQQNLIRYGFPISLVLGNLGNIFSITIFCHKRHRQNPCSLYLMSAAIFSLIGINWGIGSNMYSLYYPPDPFTKSLFLCRLRGYLLQSSSLIYKIMILFASIDRFALSSSNVKIRSFSNKQLSIKIIIGIILFGMLISIHLAIYETIENNRCFFFGTYGFFFSIYQICIFGFILPISQIGFSFLIIKNLKTIRMRVQPGLIVENEPQNVLSKRDMTLIKLVLFEIIIGIMLTTLYPIQSLYSILTNDILNKSQDRIAIESFLNFIGLIVLFYLNYCITFYLYIFISKPFRQEVKQFLFKIIKKEQTTSIAMTIVQQRRLNHN
ncbi:unnamed protein product [Adineta ricciae]|uniref:G-protein coupled receptors family 1 profile domain-containing protein n=1 Tax=Adineta ricciae TaxID=249248 RepID=A0A814TEQ7_ADIRI|nr:unnamed protein product [Adineta ricciae]CAF1437287.1 unnamed protein product [Adineta ricciae]